jgi:hypothetical protein
MKMNWEKFIGKTLNITMHENYGLTLDPKTNSPFYEIVFKTGTLTDAYDEGLLLETTREQKVVKIFIPYSSIKCVEIFNLNMEIN